MNDPLYDEQTKRETANQANLREMMRASHDLIRIFNPLDEPFRFQWDGFWHTIPAKGYKDVQRFLARHYVKKIIPYILGKKQVEEGQKALEKAKRGGKVYTDKYEENTQIWDKIVKLDNPEEWKRLRNIVVIGMVEEYGMDIPVNPEDPMKGSYDNQDQAFDRAPLRKLSPEEVANTSSVPSADEVTQ